MKHSNSKRVHNIFTKVAVKMHNVSLSKSNILIRNVDVKVDFTNLMYIDLSNANT